MIRIRIAGPGDEAAVSAVLRDSYPALMARAYPPEILERALPLMVNANPRLLASGTYYLAENGDEPVGCGGWTFDEPGAGTRKAGLAHIRHFGVRSAWVGRGIGRQLYLRCETDARAAAAVRFLCFSSLNGEAFYSALGFAVDERRDLDMGAGVMLPSVVMSRSI